MFCNPKGDGMDHESLDEITWTEKNDNKVYKKACVAYVRKAL